MAGIERPWPSEQFRELLRVQQAPDPVSAVTELGRADTGANPIKFFCTDGKTYWCKAPGNPHGDQSLLHELIMPRVARWIDAPAAPSSLVMVSADLAEALGIRQGTWVGSLEIGDAHELTEQRHISKDDNSRRFPLLSALWQLCLGEDPQYVYEFSADNAVWSIDHGLWFDNFHHDTHPTHLRQAEPTVWEEPDRAPGYNLDVYVEIAAVLEQVSVSDLAGTFAGVPSDWQLTSGIDRFDRGVSLATT